MNDPRVDSRHKPFLRFAFQVTLLIALVAWGPSPQQLQLQREPPAAIWLQLAQEFDNHELALIFLTNQGRLEASLQNHVESAGVAHFLAISAAQLNPTIQLSLSILGWIALQLLWRLQRHPQAPLPLLPFQGLRRGLSLLLCAVLASFYGSTGSLLRIAYLQYAANALFPALLSRRWLSGEVAGAHTLSFVVLTLFVIRICFERNLLFDWSFLYATTGAAGCSLAHAGLNLARPRAKPSLVLSLVLTQLICTGLFWPLHPVNPLAALGANLLTTPIVTIWIVPTTLILGLGVATHTLPEPFLEGLVLVADQGLTAFAQTARLFGALEAPEFHFLERFGTGAQCYLLIVVLLFLCSESRPQIPREQKAELGRRVINRGTRSLCP